MTADPVRQDQGFLLIVRDVDRRPSHSLVKVAELELHLLAKLPVERAERLVHQQHRGLDDQRPGQRDPLLLAAGELGDPAVAEAVELERGQRLARRGAGCPARAAAGPGARTPTFSNTSRCGNRA